MTAEEIDSMEAGRELDCLVAERVMGYVLEGADAVIQAVAAIDGVAAFGTDGKIHYFRDALPSYSTDIAAAWDVVERLTSRGHPMFLELDSHGAAVAGPYYAKVAFWAIYADYSYADTAPLAICRAVLKTALTSQGLTLVV